MTGQVGFDQVRPFGEQHRLDPCGEPAQRDPQMQRHIRLAVRPEKISVDDQIARGRHLEAPTIARWKDGVPVSESEIVGRHSGYGRGGVADRCRDRTAPRPCEARTGTKLERRRDIHLPKGILDEAKPGTAAIARGLRNVLLDQSLKHAQPIERDQPERQLDMIVAIARKRSRLIGDSRYHAKQRQLVCRRLGILQNDPAHQRKRTRGVVGQFHHDVRPRDTRSAQGVIRPNGRSQVQPVLDRKPLDLLGGHDVHRPIVGQRPVAQAHDQPATRLQQRDELAKRAAAVTRRDVHPDRTQPYQVGLHAALDQPLQPRQPIRFPTDPR